LECLGFTSLFWHDVQQWLFIVYSFCVVVFSDPKWNRKGLTRNHTTMTPMTPLTPTNEIGKG
jgi:hypothetical protein